jgi:hypothetical protein
MAEEHGREMQATLVVGHSENPLGVIVGLNGLKGIFSAKTARDLAALIVREAEVVEALSAAPMASVEVESETIGLSDARTHELAKAHDLILPPRS